MKYTVKGMIHGQDVEVTWEDGRLTGDPDVISLVQLNAMAKEGTEVGWEGQRKTKTNHLDDPGTAAYLIYIEMDEVTEFIGDKLLIAAG
ncbi:hypothetical protein [Acetonema longum]|uniref:Uncharacterized protein n=1 Tax=Acetonema longum DSM 6540 TaxID=1009370 RepID=F7NK78_9FIRM|nr:hypothetical protein [Acetonema longum]EGO63519.1 hypothetical protein ALO_12456 [Acetonema longum DSM 6540]